VIDNIVTFLQGILRLNRAVESILIDVIAVISPWLAPILPAFLTGNNLYTILGYPLSIVIIVSAVIETVGLSSMSTILMLWTWNQEKRERDPQAPIGLAVLSGVIYISIVLSVNTLLEIDPARFKILVNGLMSCMTIVAALIIGVRGQHARVVEEVEKERNERKEERKNARTVQLAPRPVPSANVKNDWRSFTQDEKIAIQQMAVSEIMKNYHVSKRAAQYWRSRVI
jgi:hypothetical protein